MSPIGTFFSLACAVALVALPRKWAPLPLLLGACYMTLGQGVDIGPFHFYVLRILIFTGLARVIVRHERLAGGLTSVDCLMLCMGVWALCTSPFHKNPGDMLVNDMGFAYNALGVYFLIRCFSQSVDEVVGLVVITAIVLVPVGLEMVREQLTHHNLFALFGAVPNTPFVRDGRVRSQGPFGHPILAGTVGAVCAPLMIGIWRRHPRVAKLGLGGCLLVVVTSASSGPLLSLICAASALVLWRWRHLTPKLRVAGIVGYILLDMVMQAPAYYLMARMDIVGGSTGWHRAALIQASTKHFSEWWFCGTDYTRDWMPTGVSWSKNYSDITNYYIALGVRGGFALMSLFILILWTTFRHVGYTVRLEAEARGQNGFFVWSLGASLFAHAATSMSIAYFDQSFMFLYLDLAAITSIWAVSRTACAAPASYDSQARGASIEALAGFAPK
jgi:hypothetical protein